MKNLLRRVLDNANWQSQTRSKRHRHSNVVGRKNNLSHAAGLDYDHLEPRRVLTTFIVNTISDANLPSDGFVSLREAVTAANNNAAFGDAPAGDANGDLIWFDPSISGSTIQLSGRIIINDDVFIQGGTNNITIDGRGVTGLFENYSHERVGFSQLTFSNGRAVRGGAILSVGNPPTGFTGTTLIVDSTFTGNEALGQGGGAIYHSHGNLNIINSDFDNNHATGEPGSGGAVYLASGRSYISGGSMTSNSANGGGGAMEIVDADLFAFNLQVGGAEVDNDEGLGNLAGDTQAKPANGGGFRISGTAFVSINGGIFNENIGARNGGAIWTGPNAQLYVRAGANLAENQAAGNSINDNGGGGIFNSGGRVYVTNANIHQNLANGSNSSGGGIFSENGILRLTRAVVSENSAPKAGGGVSLDSGFALFDNSFIRDNDAGVTLAANPGIGGGVYMNNDAILVMHDGDISNNTAEYDGGGVWAGRFTQLFVRNDANIRDNRTLDFGTLSRRGAIGGGVYTEGYLQVLDSFFLRNETLDAAGGLYVSPTGFARIAGSNFNGNRARTEGAGGYNDGFVRFTDTSFVANIAGMDAGAWYTSSTATTINLNSSFVNNLPNDTN